MNRHDLFGRAPARPSRIGGFTPIEPGGHRDRRPAAPGRAGRPGTDPTPSVWDIRDGTTSTIVIGEAPVAPHGIRIGPKNVKDRRAPIDSRVGMVGKLSCDSGREFLGYHHSGANFLHADGSARFPKEQIDPKVRAALLFRRGWGIPVADEF